MIFHFGCQKASCTFTTLLEFNADPLGTHGLHLPKRYVSVGVQGNPGVCAEKILKCMCINIYIYIINYIYNIIQLWNYKIVCYFKVSVSDTKRVIRSQRLIILLGYWLPRSPKWALWKRINKKRPDTFSSKNLGCLIWRDPYYSWFIKNNPHRTGYSISSPTQNNQGLFHCSTGSESLPIDLETKTSTKRSGLTKRWFPKTWLLTNSIRGPKSTHPSISPFSKDCKFYPFTPRKINMVHKKKSPQENHLPNLHWIFCSMDQFSRVYKIQTKNIKK